MNNWIKLAIFDKLMDDQLEKKKSREDYFAICTILHIHYIFT